MNVLLIYPLFPKTFWSFEKTLDLVGRKAMLPPLGLVTVAAILPQTWEFRLCDRNVSEIADQDWQWADLVILSGMIVQKEDFIAQIRAAKAHSKLVAVGGPYPSSLPDELAAAGADFLVLDEGELTLPMFVEAIEAGATHGTFRSTEKPDVTITPVPRYDLLDLGAYSEMSVQFSRGCPFQCEFCDIIVLYGRKPRTKNPEQLLAELQYLYDLGWRRSIFLVDDNFIGNKRNVKLLLKAMIPWMQERGYPFTINTEASVDLAQDQELMDSMVQAGFSAVFLGIETPDEGSLEVTRKFQNTRDPLSESVQNIVRSGLRVMAGFIVGFDGEKSGAGQRIVEFVEKTTIPTAFFSMLQALPNTALWHRLEREERLLVGDTDKMGNQTQLMNFIPTRPIEEIAQEYINGFWQLYDPLKFMERAYEHVCILEAAPNRYNRRVFQREFKRTGRDRQPLDLSMVRALLIICWRQGVIRKTRVQFWIYLAKLLKNYPLGVASFLGICAQIEHFLEYRSIVKSQIEAQLALFLKQKARHDTQQTKVAA
ncbi:B12-binding domain-containing radical SAM protein [Spirulina major CS-329]|uniref:B12-binding domain-containing radical SAM protein n=1 Tax=Spirulina TaxID=1154 RepID=UPI00232EB82F|nr:MULTISPECIES: B12-binding domain-containing radical SAM protein [Spirulina]MDB9495252.1 B12-binding domain-containing radical SAM protein [Spirulina subsalsa CS-330]MDB9501720.1 B12-binding domain-containing radical SAM protein [Spirulina major CS-329]